MLVGHIRKPHAERKLTALFSIEMELLPIEVLHYRSRDFRAFFLLWPWSWPNDLHIRTWPASPQDVSADQK